MPAKKPKPATCRAYVAKRDGELTPWRSSDKASAVWNKLASHYDLHRSDLIASGWSVVPILMTEILRKPRTKRKGK